MRGRMNPPQRCTAKLTDKLELNTKFTQFTFEYVQPPTVPFMAGQYVSLRVSERGDRRAYSICNSSEMTHGFELLVEMIPGGKGSTFLANLDFGQTVDVLAPMGMFTMADPADESEVVMIATGSGIAPYRSMVLDRLQVHGDQRPITLYWGVRFVQDLCWVDEFEQLSRAFPNFKFHPVVSRPEAAWPLCRGRVTDCLRVHVQPSKAGYYVCGSGEMIKDVVAWLQAQSVPEDLIHHEKFS
jgi:ferredoxin-NADP reductase